MYQLDSEDADVSWAHDHDDHDNHCDSDNQDNQDMSWAHGQDGQCDSNDHDDHWDPIDQYLSTIIIITVIRMKIVSLTYDYFNQSIIINYNKWDPDDYSLYCYHFVSWVHNHDNHCFLVTWLRLPTAWSIIHFIILFLLPLIMMSNVDLMIRPR